MDEKTILQEAEDKMKKVIETLKKTLASMRTGRASPALLEKVMVDYYGVPTPVNQVATIGVTPPRTLVVQAWDKKMLGPIEKAIQKADLGVMPVNDGNVIRVTIPALSGERRQEIVKGIRKQAEAEKVNVRNVRRDAIDVIRKAEKNKQLSEDQARKIQDKVQKLTDKYIKAVDEVVAAKEKEVMEV
ncbi:MAG: ribosome recycling factor [Bacillota bacterium]|jgi:ribosome recycling factor|nr:ribosome recycling factor [Candidatus Fermentithermobacillaceae bacterium]